MSLNFLSVMQIYPFVFVTASLVRSIAALFKALRVWSLSIRDKEFLVEMRLKNHVLEEKGKEKRSGGTEADAALQEAAAVGAGVADELMAPPAPAVVQAHLIDPPQEAD